VAVLDTQGENTKEKGNWLPWIVAGAVVVIALLVLILLNSHSHTIVTSQSPTQVAPADPYAANIPITNLQMSESSNLAGGKVTYIDGHIANHGQKTVTGIVVQIAFRSYTGEFAQRETLPLNLIRTREPYVDTQPVSAQPLKPGDERDFRLIFDNISPDWNQTYPEIRATQIAVK
jgi:Protein of unknown function (DUF2393)